MNTLKKLGRILFCLLPVLLAFVIQVIVSFGGVFLKFILELISNHDSLNQMTDADYIMDFVMDSQFLAGLSAIYAIIAALILGFWYWKRFVPKKQPRREINSLINFPVLVGLILLMLGMQYISNYVVLFLASIKPSWYQTYEDLMKSIGFGNVTLILALYSIVIAPISEELVFRGVTLKYATKALPFFAANILQAFLFGAFHGNVVQGVYAFVVGLFCGYVCYHGGSIYLSILFHMLFNLWGTFAPEALSYEGSSVIIHLTIFAFAVCAAIVGVILYQRGIKKRSPMPEAYKNN
ncbi:MAG: CPBP family intramembrane metalloprotease [Lachnospiraceae bacterium]|jgi:membrane protease YdiL (CAAX protease family)|nr:CPBP family intramembrane metalloprotease [Lachnospiraceae bacterium]